MNQPTELELQQAWSDCIQCECAFGTLQELYEMRLRKTTWVGESEHKLLFGLDDYLRDKGMSPYGNR
jgi:hypothetical protein